MKQKLSLSLLVGALIALSAPCVSATDFDHLLIIGDATPGQWSISDGLMMVQDSGDANTFRYTGWLKANENFKFTGDTGFNSSALELRNGGDDEYDSTTLVPANEDTNGDKQFKVRDDANYEVTVNVSELTISIVKAEYQDKAIRYNVLYAVGSACPGKWNLGTNATPLYNSKEKPFEFTCNVDLTADTPNQEVGANSVGDKDGEFKFCANPFANWGGEWFHPYFIEDENGNLLENTIDYNKLTTDRNHDVKWHVAPDEAGNYALMLNPDEMTFSKTKNTSTTGVENISVGIAEGETKYYDLRGVRISEPRRGSVCIEVRADGTARKVIF